MLYKAKKLTNTFYANEDISEGVDILSIYERGLRNTSFSDIVELRWLTPKETVIFYDIGNRNLNVDKSTYRPLKSIVRVNGELIEYNLLLPTPDKFNSIVKSGVNYQIFQMLLNTVIRIEHKNIIFTVPKEKMLFKIVVNNYVINDAFTTIHVLRKVIANGSALDKKEMPAIMHLLLKNRMIDLMEFMCKGEFKVVKDYTEEKIDDTKYVIRLVKSKKLAVIFDKVDISDALIRLSIGILSLIDIAVYATRGREAFVVSKDNTIYYEEIDRMFMLLLPRKESVKATLKVRETRLTQIEEHLLTLLPTDVPAMLSNHLNFDSFWMKFEDMCTLSRGDTQLYERYYNTWSFTLQEHYHTINKLVSFNLSQGHKGFQNALKRQLPARALVKSIHSPLKKISTPSVVDNSMMIDTQVMREEHINRNSCTGTVSISPEDRATENAITPSDVLIGGPLCLSKGSDATTPTSHLNPFSMYDYTIDGMIFNDDDSLLIADNSLTVTTNTMQGEAYDRDGKLIRS